MAHLHRSPATKLLPPGFVAEPRVRLETLMEIDVGAMETDVRAANRAVNRKRQRGHSGLDLDRLPSGGRGRDGAAR